MTTDEKHNVGQSGAVEFGCLYVVSTPIGNLGDITYRAVEVLRNAAVIASEDTRRTSILSRQYDIKTPRRSFNDHNVKSRVPEFLKKLKSGEDVALVSDAGTPGISDPGYVLIRSCIDNGITVTSVPGPAALVAALVISGLPTERFVFEGFLPVKKGRKTRLELLADEKRTIILYESPHRIKRTLADIAAFLGDRDIAVIREITKMFEEVLRMKVSEAIEHFRLKKPRGEFVLVIRGA